MLIRRAVLSCCLALLMIGGGTAAQDEPEQVKDISAQVSAFDADVRQLRELIKQSENVGAMDRQALVFRRDDRSFTLLADADELVEQLLELPEDNPTRISIISKLVTELENASEAVFSRLESLSQHIAKNTAELEGMSAQSRVSTEAYLQALESIRFRYYEALIRHLESRKLLGMTFEEQTGKLQEQVYLHAESLTGKLEYMGAAIDDVEDRIKQDPKNADLTAVLTTLNLRHGELVDQLTEAVSILRLLEFDTSDYDAVLLQHNEGVSVSLLKSGVLGEVVADGIKRVTGTFVEYFPDILLKLVIFLLVLMLFRWLSRLTRRVVRASCDRSSLNMSVLLKDIMVSASGGAVMVLGILMALSQIGISLGPMLAGLGVAGFIVGFALQDTLGNFAAGAMILIYRPYDVDDFVEVTGASGLVKKMSLVSTTITTFDNQTLVIPNSKIWGDVIKNVTAQKLRRVDLEFGIGYGDDIVQTEQVLADILDGHEMVLKSPAALIKVHTLGESSVNFIVRPWTKTEDYWDVYWDLTREVKLRFDREGISIPFPQRDVHVYKNKDAVG